MQSTTIISEKNFVSQIINVASVISRYNRQVNPVNYVVLNNDNVDGEMKKLI